MTPKLKILREVTNLPTLIRMDLEKNNQIITYDDRTEWVDADYPRDTITTDEIMRSTRRFAVADEHNGILAGPYGTLEQAERARASAKVQFNVEVEMEDEEEAAATESAQQTLASI